MSELICKCGHAYRAHLTPEGNRGKYTFCDKCECREYDGAIVVKNIQYSRLYRAAESMYHDLIALGQAVPEEACRIFGKK